MSIDLDTGSLPYGLLPTGQNIFIADHKHGMYSYCMDTHKKTEITLDPPCQKLHGLCRVNNDIIFTDQHRIKVVDGIVNNVGKNAHKCRVLTGMESPGSKDGYNGLAAFTQPTGIGMC